MYPINLISIIPGWNGAMVQDPRWEPGWFSQLRLYRHPKTEWDFAEHVKSLVTPAEERPTIAVINQKKPATAQRRKRPTFSYMKYNLSEALIKNSLYMAGVQVMVFVYPMVWWNERPDPLPSYAGRKLLSPEELKDLTPEEKRKQQNKVRQRVYKSFREEARRQATLGYEGRIHGRYLFKYNSGYEVHQDYAQALCLMQWATNNQQLKEVLSQHALNVHRTTPYVYVRSPKTLSRRS